MRSKKERGLCVKHGCSKKGHARKGYLCHKHYRQMDKERNPYPYLFAALRANAKRRNKPFNLSFSEFKFWCKETGYHHKCGRSPGMYQVDRIDITKGYELGNIQIMEGLENVRKYHAYEALGLDYSPPVGNIHAEIAKDCPF